MTMPGLLASARTLAYYTRRQEVTANNLANVETDGFKADRIVARLAADGSHPLPEQALDLTQGSLEQTGRPFDLALDGPGFFVVRTADGERLTRGGTFTLDADGTVSDGRGGQLMGDGGPIRITGRDVRIDAQGRISVDGQAVDALRIATVADPRTLTKAGEGRLMPNGPIVEAEGTAVRQGVLEQSNVDPMLGMVEMLMIQRAFAANTDAMKTLDGALATVTGDLGRV